MPNIKSAIKRVKIAEKKTLNHSRLKSEYKTAVKKYEAANAKASSEEADLLSVAKSDIDHACSKGVISKNAASRKKSRLEKKLAVKAEPKKAPAKKTTAKAEKAVKEEKAEVKEAAPKKETKKATKKAE